MGPRNANMLPRNKRSRTESGLGAIEVQRVPLPETAASFELLAFER